MDITDIQKPNDIYNVIICSHVLEHVVNDSKAIAEIFRVLKKMDLKLYRLQCHTLLKRHSKMRLSQPLKAESRLLAIQTMYVFMGVIIEKISSQLDFQ